VQPHSALRARPGNGINPYPILYLKTAAYITTAAWRRAVRSIALPRFIRTALF